MFFFFALSLLFQPFIKITLGRLIWNVIDIALAAFLIGSLFIQKQKETKMGKNKLL